MEIVRRSVREQVLEVLRKAILDHIYPLGSRINLDELKRSLGVSNTPLREAISILEGEGLVEYRQNAGVFVVSPAKEEVFLLAQYMLFLVSAAYDYCVENTDMDSLCRQMEKELSKQREYVEKKDRYHYALCSNSFDRCLIDRTQNPYLIRSYDKNYALLTLLNAEYAEQEEDSMTVFFHQHEQILEAIRAGNRDRVHELLKEHYYKKEWIPGDREEKCR